LWDVSGNIEPIDDSVVANRILDKVNQLNTDTGRDAILITGIWSALPQEMSSTIAVIGVLFSILYYLNDVLPSDENS